jgi:hypothetical protein
MLKIEIKDSGNGIPENKIKQVLIGLSLKHKGKGLGLSSAHKYMNNIKGNLEIFSIENEGTSVNLNFPAIMKPDWFPDSINVNKSSIVVILDDDASIHNFWKHKFQENDIKSLHFMNSKSIVDWYQSNENSYQEAIYLIDYELKNDSLNGLEIFNKIEIAHRGYLITSHAEEVVIQAECEKLKIWLVPKVLVGEMQINYPSVAHRVE